jgi:hypothetical protein
MMKSGKMMEMMKEKTEWPAEIPGASDGSTRASLGLCSNGTAAAGTLSSGEAGLAQIMVDLETEPKLGARLGKVGQAQTDRSGDRSSALHDGSNRRWAQTRSPRGLGLSQAHRQEKVLPKVLPRLRRIQNLLTFDSHAQFLAMIVYNLDRLCAPGDPAEANPPLTIDSDTILTAPVAFQGFKAVSGRGAQVAQVQRLVDLDQATKSSAVQVGRQTARRDLLLEEPPGARICERADHEGNFPKATPDAKPVLPQCRALEGAAA